jgi:hypothetical protein
MTKQEVLTTIASIAGNPAYVSCEQLAPMLGRSIDYLSVLNMLESCVNENFLVCRNEKRHGLPIVVYSLW